MRGNGGGIKAARAVVPGLQPFLLSLSLSLSAPYEPSSSVLLHQAVSATDHAGVAASAPASTSTTRVGNDQFFDKYVALPNRPASPGFSCSAHRAFPLSLCPTLPLRLGQVLPSQ